MNTTLTLREALAGASDGAARIDAIVSLLRDGAVLDMTVGAIEQLIEARGEPIEALWASAVLAPALARHERVHLLAGLRAFGPAASYWKAEALAFLAPALEGDPALIWQEIWEIVEHSNDGADRGLLAATIVERMPVELQGNRLAQAYALAQAMVQHPYQQGMAVLKLIPLLEQEQARAACALATSTLERISNPHQRFLIASALANHAETLADTLTLLTAALDAITAAPNLHAQQWMLRVLTPRLAQLPSEAGEALYLRACALHDATATAIHVLGSGGEDDASDIPLV